VLESHGKAPVGSFNGAGALRPRKATTVLPGFSFFDRLQWGRGVEAPESIKRNPLIFSHLASFNGAGALRPRKVQ